MNSRSKKTKKTQPVTWTMEDDAKYAALRHELINADEQDFDTQCAFVDIRNKAIACGLDVDPLPF